jgi:lysine-N-methylase
VYWIYTYFCGAVYDGEIFAKVKMAVVCTLLIHELDMGAYLKNGRVFCLEDQIDICYRFSRELEHSDLNLNAFEDLLASDKLFALENMLKIC